MHAERDGNIAQLPHHKHRKEIQRRNSVGSGSSESKSSDYHGSHRGRSNAIRNMGIPNGSRKGKVMIGQNNVRSASSESRTSKDHGSHIGANSTLIRDDMQQIPRLHIAPGMFNGSQNVVISGGSFANVIPVYDRRGLKLLTKHVAHTAFHNSAQRIDPPRCHPKTRKEVLDIMFEWIMRSEHRGEWIMWLNGAAGAGKSAIMQSLAERCLAYESLIVVASFFFFRSDSTRNSIGPLVATLAYQLIQAIPEVSDDIQHVVGENPLIFNQAIETQLQQLIVQPYLRLPAHLRLPFVVFIDGLDECVDHIEQATLIKVFANISRTHDACIVFLIASRREPQIETAFGKKRVTGILQTISLDQLSVTQTTSDIWSFVTAKFNDIKKTHLRKHYLPADWPQESSIETIVNKSSGQFIYAFSCHEFYLDTTHTAIDSVINYREYPNP
ncbi:hypothetical protein BDN70DRAFT_998531 [Pholiota conissans]|uniref:Nephrocystin 3-like N-terminal domain-containing protein n=1 Tax=Pholiota conissans TaxID=109636 RepID=A0A9P6CT32_9AGAR|nr:hypothetical protein BDN70DRAFT_998531 [Pholiota conissans]